MNFMFWSLESDVFPIYAMRSYKGSSRVAVLALYLGTS
jgi:hypothetical protein